MEVIFAFWAESSTFWPGSANIALSLQSASSGALNKEIDPAAAKPFDASNRFGNRSIPKFLT